MGWKIFEMGIKIVKSKRWANIFFLNESNIKIQTDAEMVTKLFFYKITQHKEN